MKTRTMLEDACSISVVWHACRQDSHRHRWQQWHWRGDRARIGARVIVTSRSVEAGQKVTEQLHADGSIKVSILPAMSSSKQMAV